jgi:CheY-like chemotaxis protein
MARILVIEDEAHIRDNLLRFVRLEGHEGLSAADGHAGLQAGPEQQPDLIFCDVMMPRMNGLEVLAALQADAALKQVPLGFPVGQRGVGTARRSPAPGRQRLCDQAF